MCYHAGREAQADGVGEPVLAVLDSTDTILLLETPDIAALKNVRLALDVMADVCYSTEKSLAAVNQGKFLVVTQPDAPVSKAMNALARYLVGAASGPVPAASRRRGFWQRLLR